MAIHSLTYITEFLNILIKKYGDCCQAKAQKQIFEKYHYVAQQKWKRAQIQVNVLTEIFITRKKRTASKDGVLDFLFS